MTLGDRMRLAGVALYPRDPDAQRVVAAVVEEADRAVPPTAVRRCTELLERWETVLRREPGALLPLTETAAELRTALALVPAARYGKGWET